MYPAADRAGRAVRQDDHHRPARGPVRYPGVGWGFSVVLTGQDGFSADQARGFAATAQPFLFGVCAPGGTAPVCSADPATVPKAVDVITPAGVSQATELDPT
jgi:carbohydrate-binding DOMON domain-containing protein